MKLFPNNIRPRIFNYIFDLQLRISSRVLCLLDQSNPCSLNSVVNIAVFVGTSLSRYGATIWQSRHPQTTLGVTNEAKTNHHCNCHVLPQTDLL